MNNDRKAPRDGRRARPMTALFATLALLLRGFAAVAAVLLALLLLAGCGQKGPLFLPDDAKDAQESAAERESNGEKDDGDPALPSG